MVYIIVDVESDGAVPHLYSMVCFGAVILDYNLDKTFYGKVKPISDKYNPEALAISGFSRDEHEQFDEPKLVMKQFADWIKENVKGRPTFISDNPAFDWQFINYYFHLYLGYNPFGFSARRIGDLYCGLKKDLYKNEEWKNLYRKTVHDHNPVNDAKGNAEALLSFQQLGLKFIEDKDMLTVAKDYCLNLDLCKYILSFNLTIEDKQDIEDLVLFISDDLNKGTISVLQYLKWLFRIGLKESVELRDECISSTNTLEDYKQSKFKYNDKFIINPR